MGITHAFLTIKNPAHPEQTHTTSFLVDSGAIYTVVPKDVLAEVGINPVREEIFILANGKEVRRKVGHAIYKFKDKEGAAPVLFGEKDDASLLGVLTLEALGLNLDPLKRELYSTPLRM